MQQTSVRPNPKETTVQYAIDAAKSKLTVQAFASGLLSALGHNPTLRVRELSGDLLIDIENLEQSSVRVIADGDSIEVLNDVREEDRREITRRTQEEVLETKQYGNIVYDSSRVSSSKTAEGQYWVAVLGKMNLHGVTREQTVEARVSIDGDSLRTSGEFTVKQSQHQIQLVSALGGTIKVKDDVKVSFEIVARKVG